mgnify:CR=1 FL=1
MGETLQAAPAIIRPPLLSAPSLAELTGRFRGQDIILVGNGPTGARDYSSLGKPLWTVNGGWRVHEGASLCWMMDDLEGPAWDVTGVPAMPRAHWEPITQACPVPIVTSVAYPEKFPQTVAYPLEEVLARFPKGLPERGARVYFAETICYATAWAIYIGVKSISFGGCDYGTVRPSERAGLEYWIGRAEEAGIPVGVFPGSQLMSIGRIDGKHRHVPGIYGYTDWPFPKPAGYEVGDFPDGSGVEETEVHGLEALNALLAEPGIESVLDVGYGNGDQAREMASAGKRVIGVDLHGREGFNNQHNGGSVFFLQQDYMDEEMPLSEKFDAVWSCHVLEHVDNPQAMLRKMFSDLKDGGLLVLTIPPAQHAIVGGHFTLWNAGQLLYHLVRAGFDCRAARVKQYGYNISVLVRKAAVPNEAVPAEANYPIERLKAYFPASIKWEHGSFNGDIRDLNW